LLRSSVGLFRFWQLHSGATRYRKARANSKVTKCDFLYFFISYGVQPW